MKRNVSSTFAAIVILFVLVVGTLYFMYRYRADAIHQARVSAALTKQMEAGRRSGKMAAHDQQLADRRAARSSGRAKPSPPARVDGGPNPSPAAPKPAGK